MAVKNTKLLSWGQYDRDAQGQRKYKLTFQVETDDPGSGTDYGDGPAVIRQAAGLYQVGAVYAVGNDLDLNAYCTPEMTVKPDPQFKRGAHPFQFIVEQIFSTLPNTRCQDEEFEDPLLEPQKVSGGFGRFSKEALFDANGNIIKTSSHEPLRGSEVEFDENRPAVHIEQNVADLQLPLCTSLIAPRSSVNNSGMWGLGAGTVKFASFQWVQKFYGTCDYYYTRVFDFEIDFEGWNNRFVLDKGTRVLYGEWNSTGTKWVIKDLPNSGGTPDPDNPNHFIRFKDQQGENRETILDGEGRPYNPNDTGTGSESSAGIIYIPYYPAADLFQLGIPSTIGAPS